VSQSDNELKLKIRADFDRIALLERCEWDHNSHYHRFLMKHVPAHCEQALDIGCGTGSFSRLLATRSDRVLALDLSPQMIRAAMQMSGSYPNIDYRVADVTSWEFPTGRFECIASITTLHHLYLKEMLSKMESALKIGGSLVVLDLFRAASLSEFLMSAIAVPVSLALRLVKTGRLRESPDVRQAWAEHSKVDIYPTLCQVRQACARILPGAKVRRHLLWRYSLVWVKIEDAF
jgi:ubiquinone/menaquinone biosynthesis C-methylase UbiE